MTSRCHRRYRERYEKERIQVGREEPWTEMKKSRRAHRVLVHIHPILDTRAPTCPPKCIKVDSFEWLWFREIDLHDKKNQNL